MLLGDTVTKMCESPRNSTCFNRQFLLVRGWSLGTRLHTYMHMSVCILHWITWEHAEVGFMMACTKYKRENNALCKTLIIVTKSLLCTTDSVHNAVLSILHIHDPQEQQLCNILLFIQVASSLNSEVQHTKTTVLWSWRTLVKVVMPCSV